MTVNSNLWRGLVVLTLNWSEYSPLTTIYILCTILTLYQPYPGRLVVIVCYGTRDRSCYLIINPNLYLWFLQDHVKLFDRDPGGLFST
jgi:hypothetical protein